MWTNEETINWLKEQGPYYHMSLFHHHQITAKANNVAEPEDNELVTFTYPDGKEYNIKYGKLKEYARLEQEKFIGEQNDNKSDNPEGLE